MNCAQALRKCDQDLPAECISLSVIELHLKHVTPQLATGLLATRSKRALNKLHVSRLADTKVAALLGQLVGTDCTREWEYTGSFVGNAGTDFFIAAMGLHTTPGSSSLTALEVSAGVCDGSLVAMLLSAAPKLRKLVVHDLFFHFTYTTPAAVSSASVALVDLNRIVLFCVVARFPE